MDGRLDALDGLRGVAAFTVVVLHVCLIASHQSGLVWWLLDTTPLAIVRAGSAAVWLFFILSGFVLVRRHLAGAPLEPRSYYPRRAIRLYLPVLGSAVVALAARAVPHRSFSGASGFVGAHVPTPHIAPLVRSLSLLTDADRGLNGPWWSLRWEVLFSILLPLVVIVAVALRRHLALLGVVSLGCSALALTFAIGHAGAFIGGALAYLPMFGIGVALAGCEERIRAVAMPGRSELGWAAVTGCVMGITAGFWLAPATRWAHPPHEAIEVGANVLALLGAAGAIVLALVFRPFGGLLSRRPVHWLGVRSYSLYLVHEPIVVALAFGFHLSGTPAWFVVVAIVLSCAVTAVFYRLVEQPAVRLAHRVGARRPTPI